MNEETPETVAGGEVAVYEDASGEVRVDVRLDRETVWLTQRQMAEVFDSTPENVLMHLRNLFASGELEAEATTKEFLAVRTEGRRRVRRRLKHYNLDAIISVGYRVNTRRGVRFRQWATRTLHGHLVRGFTMNERRLAERGLREARETLDLLARTLSNQALVDDAGQAVLDLIAGYADTWRLLLEYDEDRLPAPPGTGPSSGVLDHERAIGAIAEFRRDLMAREQASPLFGSLRGDALAAILGNIEQTMFGEPLYRSREEKAAHLLYFVVILDVGADDRYELVGGRDGDASLVPLVRRCPRCGCLRCGWHEKPPILITSRRHQIPLVAARWKMAFTGNIHLAGSIGAVWPHIATRPDMADEVCPARTNWTRLVSAIRGTDGRRRSGAKRLRVEATVAPVRKPGRSSPDSAD